MTRYVIKRLLIMIPLLLAVGIIMYTLMEFVPGDPAQIALSTGFHTEEEIELKRESMGLNRPFVVRLGEYMKNIVLHFDFGQSLIDGTDVRAPLLKRFPNTLYIAVLSIILTVVVGLPLGIYTAVHANSLGDKVSLFVTLLFDCMPSFWTALLLVLLFSLKLGWLPPSGNNSFKYFILPTLANSLGGLAASPGRSEPVCWRSSAPTTSPQPGPRACRSARWSTATHCPTPSSLSSPWSVCASVVCWAARPSSR